ncbi:MAG: 16S rRNA (guanine(527)-N(7))-methyltransferase RsmG [Clostridia bacterium]|nr:16S rRNA (guanine(527)-N(7))-methyltransferase RsmG [Clostridia bacterium]
MKSLVEVFQKYGIKLSESQQKMFDSYFHTLVETNKHLNLTAITEENEVGVKHFLDSVLPMEYIPSGARLIDVGSGAGFPAIPLKIMREDLQVCMLDSLNKRVNFLNETIKLLNLQSCEAVHGRAEEFAAKNRESFDVAVARAVASLDTLVEYLLPFVKVGGCAVIYKSSKVEEEIENARKAIDVLGGRIKTVKNYQIQEGNLERNVVVIEKIKNTPPKYPRGQNKPKLNPIK